MMVRLLYILGLSAVAAACGVFSLTVKQRSRSDPELDRLSKHPGVVEAFRQRQGGQRADDAGQTASPLVIQAEAFAVYLNPSVAAEEHESAEVPLTSHGLEVSAPAVRPASVSADFRVMAVSCYPERPERSMALLCAVSSPDSEARWVKEGAGIGHFVVHEIRQGLVVLRHGEQLRELAVERDRVRRTLVRDVRPADRQVSQVVVSLL